MKKNEAAKLLEELVREGGNWPCRFCSGENWTVYHPKENSACTKTNEPREVAEIKDGYKG